MPVVGSKGRWKILVSISSPIKVGVGTDQDIGTKQIHHAFSKTNKLCFVAKNLGDDSTAHGLVPNRAAAMAQERALSRTCRQCFLSGRSG